MAARQKGIGDYMPYILIGGGAIAYFGIVKPVLQKLGILNDAADNLVNNTLSQSGNQNPFDPNFYKSKGACLILRNSDADNYANIIYNAFGGFNDDEDAATGVFRVLKTQTQCSYLAERFQYLFNQDLLTFLKGGWWPQDRMSNTELANIISIVKGKPVSNI
jgi:hypothetical protein